MRRAVIKHAEQYADGASPTNTIEGFWSLVNRAWFGSHHHYTKKDLPLYLVESCWKYNNRNNDNAFGTFLQCAMA